LVGDEVVRPVSRPSERSLEKSSDRGRGRLCAINRDGHHAPGEVIDRDGKPLPSEPCAASLGAMEEDGIVKADPKPPPAALP
jgi:hypothetical protein